MLTRLHDTEKSTIVYDSMTDVQRQLQTFKNGITIVQKNNFSTMHSNSVTLQNDQPSKLTKLESSQNISSKSWTDKYLPPPVPKRIPNISSLHALQEWEGYVIEISEDDFVARLLDITAGKTVEDEEAVIPFEEISDNDNANLRLGSIFRWIIGYERSGGGSKKRVSQIVFRDLPVVTKSELLEGEAWAKETQQLLNP